MVSVRYKNLKKDESNVLNESHFKKEDYDKHYGKYRNAVIDILRTPGAILKLNNYGEEFITITDEMAIYFDEELSNTYVAYDRFNEILGKYNLAWSKIFKGPFSGYENGLEGTNKGNAFEVTFAKNYEDIYQREIERQLNAETGSFAPKDGMESIHSCGSRNTRRPLMMTKDGQMVVGGSDIASTGDKVADVKVDTVGRRGTINLSLKSGNTVSFCNAGVSKLFPASSFAKYLEDKRNGKLEYHGGSANGMTGNDLLQFFGINPIKFADVFVQYRNDKDSKKKKSAKKDEEDITQLISSNPNFYNFVCSVIGYNYILIHELETGLYCYDLKSQEDLDKFIGRLEYAKVLYPINGEAKRIDIVVKYSNIVIKFNIRNKQSGIFPTHLMSDYTILH